MRWTIRLAIPLAALIVVIGTALGLARLRFVETPQFQRLIAEWTTEQLGQSLSYSGLAIGLIPPSILWPLLIGTIEVVSLVLDRVELTAVRGADGIWIPGPVENEGPEPEMIDDAGGFEIAVRRVQVRDSTLTLIDRTVTPGTLLSLQALAISVAGADLSRPLDVQGSARLASGGRLAISGTLTLAGHANLRLELQELALDALHAYLGEEVRLDGLLGGEITLLGPVAEPEKLAVQLRVDAKSLSFGDTVIRGSVLLSANHSGDLAAPKGELSIDASGAAIEYADLARKPVGSPASATGRFAMSPNGAIRLDLSSVQLHTMDGTAVISMAETTHVSLNAPRFDLARLDRLLPAIDGYPLSGGGSIEALHVQVEPLRVEGAIVLHEVHLELSEADGISLEGRLIGRGDRIELAGARVSAGGQHIDLSGGMQELDGAMAFELGFASVGVLRANRVLSAVSSLKDVVYGPFTVTGQLSGRAGAMGSQTAFLDSLTGALRFDLGKTVGEGKQGGRIEGLSVLDAVIGAAGQLVGMAKLTSALSGGSLPDLSDHMGDEFEQLTGDFEIADGLLRTHNLQLLYRSYGVYLKGTVTLADQALDMAGKITLGDEIVDKYGGSVGGDKVVIPIAHIGGSVGAPEFGVHESALTSLTSRLLIENPIVQETLGRVADEAERVLPKAEELLGEGLGGLFGGDQTKRDAAPEQE
ncbi:MAG: DUF748 domain-containing protein [Deltaproteobacteria bacterium]|nr:DUF748 domain-containing protein [Deltaproteobacteria bacterium]